MKQGDFLSSILFNGISLNIFKKLIYNEERLLVNGDFWITWDLQMTYQIEIETITKTGKEKRWTQYLRKKY